MSARWWRSTSKAASQPSVSRYRVPRTIGNGADIDIYARGPSEPPLVAEVKARGDGEGFKTLERWLGTHDALFLWRDRAAPLVVVPLHVWLELIGRGLPPPQVKS